MKKIMLITLLLLITSSGHALFGLFEKPVTTVDMIQLHTIFNDLNATGQSYTTTCSPFHFQVPYKQTHEKTYIKVGYLPLCDVNQSSYPDHALTLYCESDYVKSWNYTENCDDKNGIYESEWIVLDYENSSAVFFQSDTPTTVFSCMFCVNDTGLIPNRTDFWIRIENTGNRVEVTNQTIEVFPQLDNAVTLIDNIIIFVNTILLLGIGLVTSLSPIIIMFSMIFLGIFLFLQLRKKAREMARRRKK